MVSEVSYAPVRHESLAEQEKFAMLAPLVQQMKQVYEQHKDLLQSARVWNISSTSRGGGVAEMLPRIMALMEEFGVCNKWIIIEANSKAGAFFGLTKAIHNNIHGTAAPVISQDDPDDEKCKRELYESVNRENALDFMDKYPELDQDKDLLIVHDPQPAAFIATIREKYPNIKCVWRCHIGLDVENDSTRAAWRFLTPYLLPYNSCVFSAREYIPSFLADKSFVIHPGIAPLSPKNRELSAYEISSILVRAGLMRTTEDEQHGTVDPPFDYPAKVYVPPSTRASTPGTPMAVTPTNSAPDSPVRRSRVAKMLSPSSAIRSGGYKIFDKLGRLRRRPSFHYLPQEMDPRAGVHIRLEEACMPESTQDLDTEEDTEIGFLYRPIITQISRWDRLKGWIPLIKAFADIKKNVERWAPIDANDPVLRKKQQKHRRILTAARLVLAGPDPHFIQDDPEGLEVLSELKAFYTSLPRFVQADIKLIELPMHNAVENALIVNAIQRASYVVVQNSVREGFGLTATEALWKRICFVGTYQACGLRTQVRDGIDGFLIKNNPEDPREVALALNKVLSDPEVHEELATNGQKRAAENFLLYRQMVEWAKLIQFLADSKSRSAA